MREGQESNVYYRYSTIAMKKAVILSGIFLVIVITAVQAHESRPAYLEIKETSPNRYEILWRTPVLSGMRLPVSLKLPEGVSNVREPITQELTDSLVERRSINAGSAGLAGKRIEFVGLIGTITDVLVRVQLRDGSYSTFLVHPSQPWIEIAAPKGRWQVAATYLTHGIDHILRGIDHLLFILGLLLIVKDRWMLLKTITAFTVAHSITLAIATLGYASAPLPPLNAAIALSILFIGVEVIRMQRGETSLTIQHPWVVAFAFGLLHGFGFASGLVALGLPRGDVPIALLLFNVGVEIGQLLFVLIILLLERSFRTLQIRWPHWVEELPAYTVGGLGAFWAIQRTAILIAGFR